MKHLISLICLCFLFSTAYAQNWCGNPAPQIPPKLAKVIDRTKTEVTIPVVVHIVWHDQEDSISTAQVHSQLAVLNEDFRALNVDIEEVFFFYQSRVADTEINFELVTTDQDGNPHAGIIYQETPFAGIGSELVDGRRRLCYESLGGSDAWSTDCYLNIWVADLGLDGVAGIGIFPEDVGVSVPPEEDGVYIQPRRFGTTGTVEEPYHLGRTTTHEIGHYLNLLHPWGGATPPPNCSPAICCDDPQYDDLVDDTEKQIRTFIDQCPNGGTTDCNNLPPNAQNFMGFADDACALMFTEGQKVRMWETLMNTRASLTEECTTAVINVDPKSEAWLDYVYWQADQLVLFSLHNQVNWQLYNSQGQLVQSLGYLMTGFQIVETYNLSAGLYVLVGSQEGRRQTYKLMKI